MTKKLKISKETLRTISMSDLAHVVSAERVVKAEPIVIKDDGPTASPAGDGGGGAISAGLTAATQTIHP